MEGHMRKRITLAIVIAGSGMIFWSKPNVAVTTEADIIQPTEKPFSTFDTHPPIDGLNLSKVAVATDIDVIGPIELLPMCNPYLMLRELEPVY
jgi:hypothetical protein